MIRNVTAVLLCIVLVLVLGACNNKKEPIKQSDLAAYPVTIGNVTLDKAPETIVSLSPSITQTLLDLGFGSMLRGVSDDCTLPDTMAQTARVGTSLNPVYAEIAALAPQLMITTKGIPVSEMDKLTQIGVRVLVVPAPSTIEGVKKNYTDMLTALNGNMDGPRNADAFCKPLEDTVAAVKKHRPGQTFTYVCLLSADGLAAGGDTLESDVLNLFGTNLLQETNGYSVPAETLGTLNPDVIFLKGDVSADSLASANLLQGSAAVAGGRLYPLGDTLFATPTVALADSLKEIALLLYPDAFQDVFR